MKIHQTIGIVAGVHALAFLLIFVSPGCSSTSKSETTDANGAAAPVVAAAPLSAPAPVQDAPAPLVAMSSGNAFYSPTRPNTPAAEALTPAAPPPDVTPAETYTVRGGDSLWLIAHHHHLKVSELAAANNLRPTSSLHSGQKLLIPQPANRAEGVSAANGRSSASAVPAAGSAPAGLGAAGGATGTATTYTVKSGDRLSTIARHFGLTTGALAAENNISDPRKIRPGQVLTIPAAGSARHARKSHAAAASAAEPPAAPDTTPAPLEPIAPSPGAPSSSDAAPVPIIPIPNVSPGSSSAPGSSN